MNSHGEMNRNSVLKNIIKKPACSIVVVSLAFKYYPISNFLISFFSNLDWFVTLGQNPEGQVIL